MSDSATEYPSSLLYKWGIGISIAILLIFSAANIFINYFAVPKFDQIFQDALPGKPLPGLTLLILKGRILLIIVAVGWPVGGIHAAWRQKSVAVFWLNIAFTLTILQISLTILALMMPVLEIGPVGMSDAPPSSLPH